MLNALNLNVEKLNEINVVEKYLFELQKNKNSVDEDSKVDIYNELIDKYNLLIDIANSTIFNKQILMKSEKLLKLCNKLLKIYD